MSRASAWTRYARLAFLIPAVLYVLFAFVVPIVYNLILSFEQTSPATISSLFAPFAGLSNYKATLIQPVTQSAIARTFIFTAGSLFFQFIIGFSLALLFNLRFPLRRLARSLIIIPWLLPLLITGFIFRFLFQAEAGAINQVLGDLHLISHPIGFLTSPGWAFLAILIANVWIGIPFFTVLLYSALQDVPVELKEAAMIDGANGWQRLIRVTLPIIRPVIEVVFVLGLRLHREGVRRGHRADPGRPGELDPDPRPVGVQPVVPAVRVRPGRRAQHHPARHSPGRRTGLHLAQPRITPEDVTCPGSAGLPAPWPHSAPSSPW